MAGSNDRNFPGSTAAAQTLRLAESLKISLIDGNRPGDFLKPLPLSFNPNHGTQLAEKQLALLKKDPNACPAAIAKAKEELLLAQSKAYCSSIRLYPASGSISELAVKCYTAKEIEAANQAAFKAKKIKETTLLKNQIQALKLELQLTGNRMFRNPQWQESYKKFLKMPDAANLKAMLDAEKEMMPPRRF